MKLFHIILCVSVIAFILNSAYADETECIEHGTEYIEITTESEDHSKGTSIEPDDTEQQEAETADSITSQEETEKTESDNMDSKNDFPNNNDEDSTVDKGSDEELTETAEEKELSEEQLAEKENQALIDEMLTTQIMGVYFTNTYVPGEKMAEQVRKLMAWTYPGQYPNDTQFLIDAGFAHRIANSEYWYSNPNITGFYEQVMHNTTAVEYDIEQKHAKIGDLIFFNLPDNKDTNGDNIRTAKNGIKLKQEMSGNTYMKINASVAEYEYDKVGIVIEKDADGIVLAYYSDDIGITTKSVDYNGLGSSNMKNAKIVSMSYYTNENIISRYLRKVFPEFNSAAVSGILANIKLESGFNQYSSCDDGTSYGLCMWHNARTTNLYDFLYENGYETGDIMGQLQFLRYELTEESQFAYVYNVLCNVENNAQGAYEAAAEFCKYYEAPLNSEAMAILRGRIAKEIYYPFYNY